MTSFPADCPLTKRQLEILRLTAAGLQANAISRRLGIAATTVQTHRSSAYRRLGVHGAPGAIVRCIREGWFKDPVQPSLPETTVRTYLRRWEAWLRTDDGGDFCVELVSRIGLELVRGELRRIGREEGQ